MAKRMLAVLIVAISPLLAGGIYEFSLINSVPEAGLFFLDPGFQNPSKAKGVYGLFSNPAALGFMDKFDVSLSFGIGSKAKFNFDYMAIESTDSQGAVYLPVTFYCKEKGGLNFLGAGYSLGNIGFGIGLLQGNYAGVGININAEAALDMNYSVEDTIYYLYGSGNQDTAVIPVTWNLATQCTLSFSGSSEGGLSSSPLFMGAGAGFGIFGIGVGMKLYKYKGDLDALSAGVTRTASLITGTPHGWNGSINAIANIDDTLYLTELRAKLNGTRTAFSVGALFDLKVLSIGLTYEKGFSTKIKNLDIAYSLINVSGSPEECCIDSIYLDPDSLENGTAVGTAYLSYSDFRKDSTYDAITGEAKLPGYSEIRLGLSASYFSLYAGAVLPDGKKELGAFYLGTATSIPLPTVTLRFGTHQRVDYFKDGAGSIIPLRISSHIGLGASIHTSLGFLGKDFGFPATINVGVKTSTFPLLANIFTKNIESLENFKAASFLSGLSFNLGVRVHL